MPHAAPEADARRRTRSVEEAPAVSRRTHRRQADRTGRARRILGRRWLPLGVVVLVAVVAGGVYVVDDVRRSALDSPSLLAVIPPVEGPIEMAPAGGNGAPPTTEAPPTAEAPAAPVETTEEETTEAEEPVEEEPDPPARRRAGAGDAPGGLPWHSGVVGGTPEKIAAWEAYRGRPVDVVHAFAAREEWDDVEDAGWILGYYADTPDLLVISQPFWAENSGGSLGACASGAYDDHWAAYGRNLVEAGRADAYTRLAWEFNGNWFQWSATDVGAWIDCYRQVVTAVHSTDPDARFEWNINAHGSQTCGGNAWNCYPGDDYVDVVGIDPYDHHPNSPTRDAFNEQCRGEEGLCTVIDFARAHNKQVGVTEWGVIDSGHSPVDNPLYIDMMYETFMAGADVMAYETYFNSDEHGTSLANPNQNPQASERYRELFGG